jgi:hypothetical protein
VWPWQVLSSDDAIPILQYRVKVQMKTGTPGELAYVSGRTRRYVDTTGTRC